MNQEEILVSRRDIGLKNVSSMYGVQMRDDQKVANTR